MSTAYTLLNGFTVAFGFILALIALILLLAENTGAILLVISLLIMLLGLQGWQYIQTLVRLDEISEELREIKNNL